MIISIEEQILKKIKKAKGVRFFSLSDFSDFGSARTMESHWSG